jgi:dihydropyrimidine dehydrogenase (NAD+) subunit PreT
VLTAIGQLLTLADLSDTGFVFAKGRVVVDGERRTGIPGVWAGGDCIADGSDLTVVAVADGKKAAASIITALQATASPLTAGA